MIDIDISKALKNEGECGTFSYEGVPELGGEMCIRDRGITGCFPTAAG